MAEKDRWDTTAAAVLKNHNMKTNSQLREVLADALCEAYSDGHAAACRADKGIRDLIAQTQRWERRVKKLESRAEQAVRALRGLGETT